MFAKWAGGLGNSSPVCQSFICNLVSQMVCFKSGSAGGGRMQSSGAWAGFAEEAISTQKYLGGKGQHEPWPPPSPSDVHPPQRYWNWLGTSSVSQSIALKPPNEGGCCFLWMPDLAQQRLSENGCCASFSPCAAEETPRFCHSACRPVACIYDWWPANWASKFTKDRCWCLVTVVVFWGLAVSLLRSAGEENSVKISLSNLWVIRVKRQFDT